MIKVAILVTPSCFASTAFSLLDAFHCASFVGQQLVDLPEFEPVLVSETGDAVVSMSGHELPVDHSIESFVDPDVIIVVPPISPFATDDEITQSIKPLSTLHPWVVEQVARGAIMASSCTGSFLLAEAGLLNGRIATTHWRAAHAFSKRYPEVVLQVDELITEDDSILCGGGAVSCIDLALHIVRRIGGAELAFRTAQILVVDPGREHQSPYARIHSAYDHQDLTVLKAQEYLDRNYWEATTITDLSEKLFVSERTLKRRFAKATGCSIGRYLQNIRVEAAQDRLTSTSRSLQAIVNDIGYEDVSSFSRLFKKTTGLTMQSYRTRFTS